MRVVAKRTDSILIAALLFAVASGAAPAAAQERDLADGARVVRLEADPSALAMDVGTSMRFRVAAYDADGVELHPYLRVVGTRGGLQVGDGVVRALRPGQHAIIVAVVVEGPAASPPPSITIPVAVGFPPVAAVELDAGPGRLYQGTTLSYRVQAFHADGSARPNPPVHWTSSNPSVATVDRFGNVTALRTGRVTITADVDGAQASVTHDVAAFPATGLEIAGGADQARTGDVLAFHAVATGAGAREIGDVPLTWSFTFTPDDSIAAPPNAGQVIDGRFVASVPGRYTILASSGPLTARRTIDVRPRDVVRRVQFVGHGQVSHHHTSDLWVFEGRDGRDYAVTGTWGGAGLAYIWDVTDPADIVRIDSIQVDARTVNDVKVSPDARYLALSREGASNRRNGVVIVDISVPTEPRIASVFDDGLTGGVHNMFATDYHLFALSAGERFVILDVYDIYNPRYVGEYRFPEPGARIHDVWVHDGLAYASQWQYGVVIVDVGNGRWGGSPEDPVLVTNIPYPVGRTHAAFPYFQESTGRFYLFLGDEILNRAGMALEGGLQTERGGTPSHTAGYIHIIDWTDPEDPRNVARYHVPEYGTHNVWVEDDKLYVAYYEGGVRVVDVSGELMGNLYEQGREIAVFKPYDPDGYIANAPMVWGPQPFKGHIFFSDFNSGLWSVRLEPRAEDRPVME